MGELVELFGEPWPAHIGAPLSPRSSFGLTEQQKQQIVPIMTQELTQLEALKKNTSLCAVQKVEQLRQLGRSSDRKIMPLLNSEQQPKFQAMREQMRRQIIEKDGSQAAEKAETDIKQKLENIF